MRTGIAFPAGCLILEAEFSGIAAHRSYLWGITSLAIRRHLDPANTKRTRTAMTAGGSTRKECPMKRAIMILATAALASTLAVGTAAAHGGGGGGGHGGFGGGGHGFSGGGFGGGHMGFGGGAHFGGVGHAGGFGGERFGGEHFGIGHVASDGAGFRQHAFHHFGRYRPGYGYYGYYPDCYDWYELHPGVPLPLSCS